MSRQGWVRVHRVAGLYLAFFVGVTGITGSVLPFASDIDSWLNPPPVVAHVSPGISRLDVLELRERALALVPRGRIDGVQLTLDADQAFSVVLEPSIDSASGIPETLPVSTLTLDPYTGRELARGVAVDGDLWPITRRNLVPVLIATHYRLALPGSIGVWLLGIAALFWTFDCFVGAYLTLPMKGRRPPRSTVDPGQVSRTDWWWRWARSWRVKWPGPARRVVLDLHRAGGLWFWLVLFLFAWSAVGLNLRAQIFEPIMTRLLPTAANPVDVLPVRAESVPEPGMTWRCARTTGRRLMTERARIQGYSIEREAWLIYDAERGLFFYGARTSRDLPGSRGESYVAFDGQTGQFVAESQPTGRAAGNTVTQWLFALHRAQVWGLPYRMFVSATGLLCTLMSITGLYLWHRKRTGHRTRRHRDLPRRT